RPPVCSCPDWNVRRDTCVDYERSSKACLVTEGTHGSRTKACAKWRRQLLSSRPSEARAGTQLAAHVVGEMVPGSSLRAVRDDSTVVLQGHARWASAAAAW